MFNILLFQLGNIIFDPHNNTVTEKVDFENGLVPANWTITDMDVIEIDQNLHGYVLLPSKLPNNNQSNFGSLAYSFQVEVSSVIISRVPRPSSKLVQTFPIYKQDKGQFELEFEMKVANYLSQQAPDDNPRLIVELLKLLQPNDSDENHARKKRHVTQEPETITDIVTLKPGLNVVTKEPDYITDIITTPEALMEKQRVSTSTQRPESITDVIDDNVKHLEMSEAKASALMEENNEWHHELDEPNALTYVIFDSNIYSKYFALHDNWVHIR